MRPDTPNQPRRRPLPSTLHPPQTLIRPFISPECQPQHASKRGLGRSKSALHHIEVMSQYPSSLSSLTDVRQTSHPQNPTSPANRSTNRPIQVRSVDVVQGLVCPRFVCSIDRSQSIDQSLRNPEHPPHERARVQRAMPAHSSPGPPCPKPRGIQPHSHGLHARGGAVPGLQWPLTFWAARLRALLVLVDRFWYNAPNASLARSVVVVCLTLSPNPCNPNHRKPGGRPARPRKCSSVI